MFQKHRNQIIFDILKESPGDLKNLSCEHKLILFDIASSKSQQLFVTNNRQQFSPSFNIATQRVAITNYRHHGEKKNFRPEIIFISLEGKPNARLSSFRSPHEYVKTAVFSPDGKRLAIEKSFDREYNPDVYILEGADKVFGEWVFDRTIAVITNPMHIGIHAPRFFTDGQRLVYLRNYAYEDALEVCLCDLTQSGKAEDVFEKLFGSFNKRRLTSNADVVWHRSAALALEPKSETAFFIRGHFKHEYEQICAVPCSANAEQDPFAATSVTELFNHIGGIYLSPDGEQFVFNADGHLYVAALDGGDFMQLADRVNRGNTGISFSPDSQYIAYIRNNDSKDSGIWLIDRIGKNSEKILIPIYEGKINELLWI